MQKWWLNVSGVSSSFLNLKKNILICFIPGNYKATSTEICLLCFFLIIIII